ncbi:MAG: hypothetical protein AABZ65_04195 [Candidatus Omnitrophota bacterium]
MRVLIGILIITVYICGSAHAYLEDYPPFKFSESFPKHVKAELLVDYDNSEYRSKDGQVTARLKESPDSFEFILTADGTTVTKLLEREAPFPYASYRVDLDNNGLNDFIVFYSNRGNGLASQLVVADLYLQKPDGSYQSINYEGLGAGIEDFIDLDQDSKAEVIIMDMHGGKEHNYFSYSVYEIKDGKLVNADNKFKGFPKFIWYTNKKNDKDTTHLEADEKASHIKKVDSEIRYRLVTPGGAVIKPLSETGVKRLISKLNKQGIVLGYEEKIKKNTVNHYNTQGGWFGLWESPGTGYYIYKADINNDAIPEYVLASFSGSGNFFDIDAIYAEKDGKFVDTYKTIKIELRKRIRDAQGEDYDLEEGYVGFMNGSVDIVAAGGKTYFTLTQIIRDYDIPDFERSFKDPKSFKFLWDNNGLALLSSVRNK